MRYHYFVTVCYLLVLIECMTLGLFIVNKQLVNQGTRTIDNLWTKFWKWTNKKQTLYFTNPSQFLLCVCFIPTKINPLPCDNNWKKSSKVSTERVPQFELLEILQ